MSWGWNPASSARAILRLRGSALRLLIALVIAWQSSVANAAHALMPTSISARQRAVLPPGTRPLRPIEIDAREFESFLDDFVISRMQSLRIPGVAFYMVKDGKTFLAKGYGEADLQRKLPMDPHETLIAAGSLTKLVTATACMQLVEQGKLDLFADVNDIITAFQIEHNFRDPITLATLLEHTDGLDVAHIGIAARTAQDVLPLETYLARHLPRRVRPPGYAAVYAEHGMALAGYLVEVASGEPYQSYISKHILQPLQMHRSGFRAPTDQESSVCVGYTYHEGRYQPLVPEFAYHVEPASGLLTTAHELGNFMIAHLNRGRFGEARLFSEQTSALMIEQKFGLHPMLSAWSYGFHSRTFRGEFCIEHGGMTRRTCVQMLMMPERGIGFVMAGNAFSLTLQKEFLAAFLHRYFPEHEKQHRDIDEWNAFIDATNFEGTYAALHRSLSTIERLGEIARQTRVIASAPDTLESISAFDNVTWKRIAPSVYESLSGDSRIAFVYEGDHDVVSMLSGPHECVRLNWWETVRFYRSSLLIIACLFITGLIASIIGFFQHGRTEEFGESAFRRRIHFGLIALLCGINLLFAAGMAYTLRSLDYLEFAFGLTRRVEWLLWLPILATALTPAAAGLALSAWVDRVGSLPRRIHDGLVASACIAYLLILAHWNMLGFNV